MASKCSAQCNPAPKRAVQPWLHKAKILDSHVRVKLLLYFSLIAIETTAVISLGEECY